MLARSQRAEKSDAGLLDDRDEAAKIGAQLLHAGANGDDVVVRAQVEELGFKERFLQADVR